MRIAKTIITTITTIARLLIAVLVKSHSAQHLNAVVRHYNKVKLLSKLKLLIKACQKTIGKRLWLLVVVIIQISATKLILYELQLVN